jgi:hypothetical protein
VLELNACLACSWKARGDRRAFVAEERCEGRMKSAIFVVPEP